MEVPKRINPDSLWDEDVERPYDLKETLRITNRQPTGKEIFETLSKPMEGSEAFLELRRPEISLETHGSLDPFSSVPKVVPKVSGGL